jgi:hypothetical protein
MNLPEFLQTNRAETSSRIAASKIAMSLAAFSIFLLTCSNPFEKRPVKPVLSVVADTTVAVKDTLILVAQNGARGGRTTGYTWQLDSHTISQPEAFDSACRLLFGIPDTGLHIVVVRASGEGNTASEPETVKVTVVLDPPIVRFLTRDTTVYANDTVRLVAQGTDPNGLVLAYRWMVGDSGMTTRTGTLGYVFAPISGTFPIRVRAMDNDSIPSLQDSIRITVMANFPRIAMRPDSVTTAINDTVVMHAVRLDTSTVSVRWLWARDGISFLDTTALPSFAITFKRLEAGNKVVRVKAIDAHRLLSNVDSAHIAVHLYPPRVFMAAHDTSVFVNDLVTLYARGTDTNGTVAKYTWAIDGIHFSDTTSGDSIVHAWSRADTGRRIVVLVKAIDNDSLVSQSDSTVVGIRLGVPLVKAMGDTAIFVHDTLTVRAAGTDTNGTIVRYLWSIDNGGYSDTTSFGALKIVWPLQDTGSYTIRVRAVDDDTIQSKSDSLKVVVKPGRPRILAQHDTTVRWGDTCSVTIAGIDSNGAIVKYLLNSTGGGSWTDSSANGTFKLTSNINTSKKVVAGVRDNDGLVATDTFTIRFTERPCSVVAHGLRPTDTVVVLPSDSGAIAVPLSFSARRVDGVADTFSFSLWAGNSPASLVEQYHGADTACSLFVSGTGNRYWRIRAIDNHADTATTAVYTLSVILHRKICFAGHSIVTGFTSTPGTGGFRRMVIDTLRAANASNIITCSGPSTTGNLVPASDDSCNAVGGKTCANIFDSLYYHPSTNADLWFYFCGVNEGYQFPTFSWTVGMANFAAITFDTMHARNPHSEIYVLNSLPFPPDTMGSFDVRADSMFKANLPVFSRMLDSVVTDRRQKWAARRETGIWLVNAYSALAALPDSIWNPSYFSDYLHPNQVGYNRLAAEIFKTMRASGSSFLK